MIIYFRTICTLIDWYSSLYLMYTDTYKTAQYSHDVLQGPFSPSPPSSSIIVNSNNINDGNNEEITSHLFLENPMKRDIYHYFYENKNISLSVEDVDRLYNGSSTLQGAIKFYENHKESFPSSSKAEVLVPIQSNSDNVLLKADGPFSDPQSQINSNAVSSNESKDNNNQNDESKRTSSSVEIEEKYPLLSQLKSPFQKDIYIAFIDLGISLSLPNISKLSQYSNNVPSAITLYYECPQLFHNQDATVGNESGMKENKMYENKNKIAKLPYDDSLTTIYHPIPYQQSSRLQPPAVPSREVRKYDNISDVSQPKAVTDNDAEDFEEKEYEQVKAAVRNGSKDHADGEVVRCNMCLKDFNILDVVTFQCPLKHTVCIECAEVCIRPRLMSVLPEYCHLLPCCPLARTACGYVMTIEEFHACISLSRRANENLRKNSDFLSDIARYGDAAYAVEKLKADGYVWCTTCGGNVYNAYLCDNARDSRSCWVPPSENSIDTGSVMCPRCSSHVCVRCGLSPHHFKVSCDSILQLAISWCHVLKHLRNSQPDMQRRIQAQIDHVEGYISSRKRFSPCTSCHQLVERVGYDIHTHYLEI